MTKKINIRPTTSVYATYKNIKYDPWTAIAEFVDNSTQSYYDHIKKLEGIPGWSGLNIEIIYDNTNGSEKLIIRDNAHGMNFSDFQRAIILDSKPSRITRSEFGMGLKTAACWFGTMWSVESVELGSGIKYIAEVDVDALSKYKNEEIEVEEIDCAPEEHGTVITIWRLNRKIVGRQIAKTKDQLRGLYRVDLRTGSIIIRYNGEELHFEDPGVLVEALPNGKTKIWRENVDFNIDHDGKSYHVHGFIALLEKASVSGAGFTLIRRGRVIIGGHENNYRPEAVFEKSNSFIYQRLFGELNMNRWPVVQTKDSFDWYSGLEDAFIDKLNEVALGYKKKAKEYRVGRNISVETGIETAISSFGKAGIIDNVQIQALPHNLRPISIPIPLKPDGATQVLCEAIAEEPEVFSAKGNDGKKIKFNCNGTSYTLNMVIQKDDSNRQWLYITEMSKNTYKIEWNVKHPFFKDCLNDSKILALMTQFIFALSLSEIEAKKTCIKMDGELLIDISTIRMIMNDMLKSAMNGEANDE